MWAIIINTSSLHVPECQLIDVAIEMKQEPQSGRDNSECHIIASFYFKISYFLFICLADGNLLVSNPSVLTRFCRPPQNRTL